MELELQLAIDNRLGIDIEARTELRGRQLVLVLERRDPRSRGGLIVPRESAPVPINQGLLGGTNGKGE